MLNNPVFFVLIVDFRVVQSSSIFLPLQGIIRRATVAVRLRVSLCKQNVIGSMRVWLGKALGILTGRGRVSTCGVYWVSNPEVVSSILIPG